MENKEKRLTTLLYNSLCLLVDNNIEQYDNSEECFLMIQRELGCTTNELSEYGIEMTADGRLQIL